MNSNRNNIPSELVFNASEPSSSQLGGAFNIDKGNTLSGNTWIYEWLDKWNIPKKVSALGMDGHLKRKGSPFNDGKSSITSPLKIIGKREPPPEDIDTPTERQKRRRIDLAQGLQVGATVSNGLSPTKRWPRITDLLPIQRDSWFHLPEMWEYRGPDGRRIRDRRWSPNQDGDHTLTSNSDRLHQNGDRNNATAATVATWVELNRLRARYQELVAEFHGGPLVVHHLADRESEEQLATIGQLSVGVEKAMAGGGRAAPPRRRLWWATAPPATKPITKPTVAMAAPQTFVSPRDTLLFVTPVEEVVSEQEPRPAPALTTPPATQPVSTVPPSSSESPEKAAPSPAPAPPIIQQGAPVAAPSSIHSSTKATKRSKKATRIPQSITPPSGPSTSSNTLSFVSATGQFRFTAAGEALFKGLAGQGKYDEAFAMLPAEQQFEHLTTPDAIAEFRSTHPQPNRGEGKKDETDLWVCKAKVRLEKKELPRANKGDAPEYEFDVVYSDGPCDGTATKHDSKVRHKNRTHLGRPYQWNSTKQRA